VHELSIAQCVLDGVQAEAARHPGAKPTKIGLKIGELAAVDPDALQFAFEVLTRETELEGLKLEIDFCARRHRCLDCGTDFEVKDFDFCCTKCRSTRNECISGDELQMTYLELEEHEPSTA
jgi:hydrogenase nickel incorporation protein HypA/HybF